MCIRDSARATLEEIEMDENWAINPDTTIKETLELMNENIKQSYGVVNKEGKLMGMVTKSDLAAVGLGDTAMAIQLLQKTPPEYIAKTINGKLVYVDDQYHFNGKTSVIAIAETKLDNYELQDRLVIVGNDSEAQMAAIRKGAGIPVSYTHLRYICPHAETINADAFRIIRKVHDAGCKFGVVLNPATPLSYIQHYIHLVDKITIMSVDPGFAGQSFIREMLDKIKEAKALKEERGYHYLIEVDGSCNKPVSYTHLMSQNVWRSVLLSVPHQKKMSFVRNRKPVISLF